MKKIKIMGYVIIIALICTMLTSEKIIANPVMLSWNSGSPAISDNTYPDNLMQDPNYQDLLFSSEYVFLEVRDIGSMKAWLDASYVISNSGSNWINQTIGIPGYSFLIQLEESDNTSIKIDGIEVDWMFGAIDIPNDYENNPHGTSDHRSFLVNVSFSPYQVRNISVDFPVTLMNHRSADTVEGTLNLIYVVTTGAQWPEPIGDATIIYSIPKENIEEFVIISPELPVFNNASQNTIMTWKYQNWTPTQEIVVSWNPDNWPLYVTTNQSSFEVGVGESISFELGAYFNGSANNALYNYFGQYYYKLDYGDNFIHNWSSNSSIEYIYSSPGNYTIKVWARDSSSHIEPDEPLVLYVNVTEQLPPPSDDISPFVIGGIIVIICVGFALFYYVISKRKT